jgi:hypothetical protein
LENSLKERKFIMKKLLLSASVVCVVFGADGMKTAGMELARIGDSRLSGSGGVIVRPNADSLVAQSIDQAVIPPVGEETVNLSTVINLRQVRNPQRDGEFVEVFIRDFCDLDARVPSGGWYTRQYPLQRTFLRYNHNLAAGFSNPVQKLYATVNDIEHADRSGELVVDPEYLDNATQIPHQRRANGQYANDDANLRAKPFTEIFIDAGGTDEIIDPAKARDETAFVAYVRTNTPALESTIGLPEARADDAQFNYQRTETLEDWGRPDGTIFTKRTEGVQKVAKPTPPAPIQVIPEPIVVNQQPPRPRSPRTAGDVVRNVLTLGSNCTIM